MGELHLEIIVDRMKREFGVEANVGKPQVAYRETIRKPVDDVEGKFVRQSGGKGQYGHVVLKIEPQEPGKGFEFVDAIKGGVVPREFIPAVEEGRRGIAAERRAGRLPGRRRQGHAAPSARTTRSTRTRTRSRWPPSFGFKDGCRKASAR